MSAIGIVTGVRRTLRQREVGEHCPKTRARGAVELLSASIVVVIVVHERTHCPVEVRSVPHALDELITDASVCDTCGSEQRPSYASKVYMIE